MSVFLVCYWYLTITCQTTSPLGIGIEADAAGIGSLASSISGRYRTGAPLFWYCNVCHSGTLKNCTEKPVV
jgi:hypothetical protein